MSKATLGLYVPADAKSSNGQIISHFLVDAVDLVKPEPETIQWYGIKFSDDQHAIFGTFAAESSRNTHLHGKLAEAFRANAKPLLLDGRAKSPVDILTSMVRPHSSSTEAKVGLHVQIVAKPEKADEVRAFLVDALPLIQDEPETLQWFAYRKSQTEFGIFDTAAGESGRLAHLNGKVATTLLNHAGELFVTTPDIREFDILSSKIVV